MLFVNRNNSEDVNSSWQKKWQLDVFMQFAVYC